MTKVKLTARKVAFYGSSPSSGVSCPHGDPEWEVWATGPGRHSDPNFIQKFTRWFELHDMEENDPALGSPLDPGYFEWLAKLEKPVYYRPPIYPGLKGIELPYAELVEKHGGYFLDSTIAFMLAYCYEYCEVDEIGLWGIDFSTEAERILQKKGTKYFVNLFKLKGVPCRIPLVSDMVFDPQPYPVVTPLGKKINSMLGKLENDGMQNDARIAKLREALRDCEFQSELIRGSMQAAKYFKDNWT